MKAKTKQIFQQRFKDSFVNVILAYCLINLPLCLPLAQSLHAQTPTKQMSDTVELLCPELAKMSGSLNPLQQDLLQRCGEVKIGPLTGTTSFEELSAEQKNGLTNMTSSQTSSMRTESVDIVRPMANLLISRLAALRAGGVSGIALNMHQERSQPVLLASLDNSAVNDQAVSESIGESGKLGVFLNGFYGTGDRDRTIREPGFDWDVYGIIGGVDYRFTDRFILGLALSYARTDATVDQPGGDLDADGYGISLYGSYYINDFYINGIGTYGRKDYDFTRTVSYIVPSVSGGQTVVNQRFEGKPDADEYGFNFGVGYDFFLKGFSFGPYGRLNYFRVDIDSYTEKLSNPNSNPGFGLALNINDQEIKSFSTIFGVRADYAFTTSIGVIKPYFRLDWQHEFENDLTAIGGNFVNGNASSSAAAANFTIIPLDQPDRDFYNLGMGINSVFPHGISAFLDYATVLDLDDTNVHQFIGGVRLEL